MASALGCRCGRRRARQASQSVTCVIPPWRCSRRPHIGYAVFRSLLINQAQVDTRRHLPARAAAVAMRVKSPIALDHLLVAGGNQDARAALDQHPRAPTEAQRLLEPLGGRGAAAGQAACPRSSSWLRRVSNPHAQTRRGRCRAVNRHQPSAADQIFSKQQARAAAGPPGRRCGDSRSDPPGRDSPHCFAAFEQGKKAAKVACSLLARPPS